MPRVVGPLIGLIALTLLGNGCADEPEIVLYSPPVQLTDFSDPLPLPEEGFLLLQDSDTTGRFSCAMALVKIEALAEEIDFEIQVAPFSMNEQAYWTETYRGINGITDLVFIGPTTVKAAPRPLSVLCDAASGHGAQLLLAYAPAQIGPNSAHLVGVMYDTERCAALATFRETLTLRNGEGDEITAEELSLERELPRREVDAYYIASRRFEDATLMLMRELLLMDSPGERQDQRWGPPVRLRPYHQSTQFWPPIDGDQDVDVSDARAFGPPTPQVSRSQ